MRHSSAISSDGGQYDGDPAPHKVHSGAISHFFHSLCTDPHWYRWYRRGTKFVPIHCNGALSRCQKGTSYPTRLAESISSKMGENVRRNSDCAVCELFIGQVCDAVF